MPLPQLTVQIRRCLAGFPCAERAAAERMGFPLAHAAAFSQIAQVQESVIMCREVGKICQSLIEEGYDSKGFKIKTKTCDWGPMAGFVCVDPRFTKKGPAAETDMAAHTRAAFRAGARPIPIRISRARVNLLTGPLGRIRVGAPGPGFAPAFVPNRPAGLGPISFALVPVAPGFLDVCIDNKTAPFRQDTLGQRKIHAGDVAHRQRFETILGLANPNRAFQIPGPQAYLNAVTGDYDLFAIWPHRGAAVPFDPRGEDRRFAHPLAADVRQREHPELGNISDRVHLAAGKVNSMLAGPAQRQMVHHSDEGGRPGIRGIDLPVIAFVPFFRNTATVGITTIAEWLVFTKLCHDMGFQLLLHPAWPR